MPLFIDDACHSLDRVCPKLRPGNVCILKGGRGRGRRCQKGASKAHMLVDMRAGPSRARARSLVATKRPRLVAASEAGI